jgi:hypothetical protein
MNSFKDFNIAHTAKGFKGDKIKVERLFNREIVVHEFRIEDSNKVPGTDCLHMQIMIGETWYVVFTSSKGLLEAIILPQPLRIDCTPGSPGVFVLCHSQRVKSPRAPLSSLSRSY